MSKSEDPWSSDTLTRFLAGLSASLNLSRENVVDNRMAKRAVFLAFRVRKSASIVQPLSRRFLARIIRLHWTLKPNDTNRGHDIII